MRVLGIESSCDELAAAILEPDGHTLRAQVIHSQEDLHAKYGGIVPEVASRDHVRRLDAVLAETLEHAGLAVSDVDGIAVTRGPGLIGSLMCGLEFAKGLALALERPLLGVHHLEGHLASVALEDAAPVPPFTTLLVSGGHTLLVEVRGPTGPYRILGRSRDDAAGEAFDKTAKMLGLGYPGGARIDRWARKGREDAVPFPRLMDGRDGYDFSFSGLKTHVRRHVTAHGVLAEQELADFCASFQRCLVDALLDRAVPAARQTGRLVLVGGVAANSALRAGAVQRGRAHGLDVFLPSVRFCTDNAAMIARAGQLRLGRGQRSDLRLSATARWSLADLCP